MFNKGEYYLNKHDLRVVKTKKGIHQALLHLLQNKPLTHIKVTELCKAANINRGTFYFHYEEVGDVFAELYEEIMIDLKASYDEPYKRTNHLTVETLDPNTIRIFHHIKRYENFYKIVLSENGAMTYYYMLFDAVRSIFISNDYTKTHEHVNGYFYSYTTNAILGLIIEWYRRGFQESAEEMNIQLVKIIILSHEKEEVKK